MVIFHLFHQKPPPRGRICTKSGTTLGVADVITCDKFLVDRLRGVEFREKFQKEVAFLIFADALISLKHSVGLVKRSLHAKNELDSPTTSIEHRLVTDRETDRQTDGQTDTGP